MDTLMGSVDEPVLSRCLQRLGAELRFPLLKLRGRRQHLAVTLLGQPVVLDIAARREIKRALSFSLEAEFTRRIIDALQPGDVVYDVGANVGLISVVLALHPAGRTCRFHSFEPEPRNFEQLSRNIALNALGDRVTPHATALGREEGEAALFVRGTAGEGRHSMVAAAGATDQIRVALTTASSFATANGDFPQVVKIDVEGAEGQVLAGMEKLIRTSRPRELFMEIHAKGEGDRMPDGQLIDAWLRERDFALAWEHKRRSGIHRHYR